jgi:hypothetical protein
MSLYASAYRASKRPVRASIFRSAVVTALLPTAAALIWLVLVGCGVWVGQALHGWTCMLPGLMLVVPPVAALLLPMLTILNQRRDRRFPDGWLVTVLAIGLLTQVLFVGAYLFALLGQGYFGLWITVQIISVPQPFIAGAIAAAVYWTTLYGAWRHKNPKELR